MGIARLTLFLPASHSLKDKRMVLRRLKSLVRDKFNAAIAEVGDNDLWQRAALGLAVVGNERAHAEASLDEILRFLTGETEARGHAQITAVDRELQTFNDAFGVGAELDKRWQG